jgi:nucleotidyltransferase substrate binding protein (TIGR01987 family)
MSDGIEPDVRWRQRFQNFERAFLLLREGIERDVAALSPLEQEGVIQRFEYTFELAWKTLKDYLEYTGLRLEQHTPRETIKQAFAAQIIPDGRPWMEMLEQRNLLAHTYNQANFTRAIVAIRGEHWQAIDGLYLFLKSRQVGA